MLDLQVLVATMHQKDHSLLDKMKIKSEAIVVNQCDENCVEDFEYNGKRIKWLSLAERGVGLSRNTALMRATGEVLLFADDDVVYSDDYEKKVISTFEKYPDADFIVFNLKSLNEERPEYMVKKDCRLHWYNCLKFGACKIAVRKESILYKNIFFPLLFGGGAKYQSGEDNIFISQCIKKGLKGYASSELIGTVAQEKSTWFRGIDEKYYHDKGALFKAMYGKITYIVVLLFELKNCFRKNEFSVFKRLKYDFQGVKDYKAYK